LYLQILFVQDVEPVHTVSLLGVLIKLAIMVIGLLLSGLFSSSEVAYFSLAHHDYQSVFGKKSRSLKRLNTMLEHPRRLLTTILIGNTFANIVTSVLAAVLTGELAGRLGAPVIAVFLVEVVILTFMIVILSEITPKIIAIKNPVRTARRLNGFVYFCYIVLTPLSRILASSTGRLEKYLPKPASRISSHDIKHIAEVGEKQGSLREDEREIIENVIEFSNTTVVEIMTSRVNIIAVSTQDSLGDVVDRIRDKSLSRLPLYENDLDNIKGIIYAKDLLPYLGTEMKNTMINWKAISRKAIFVPTSKKLDDLLEEFQREKTHMAIVVDEYGGTEGLITLDDVLSEIIGDISDEHTEAEQLYTRLRADTYIFDAKIDLDDMAEILNKELTTEEDEYETLGGLVYHLTEHIPEPGEMVRFKDLELIVHTIENNRVRKVKVRVLTPEELSEDRPVNMNGHSN